ncbi:autotransporter outer membrane beta-barrel domain-containing protein, partial [Brucella anthropi]|uniref:autotransporter outer membrane beta-barrel domain-containing protein n=1 Tax=Brucella anthropi TaxID=529 RepID=UPI00178C4DE6
MLIEHRGQGALQANIGGQISAQYGGLWTLANGSGNIDLTSTATIVAGGTGINVSQNGTGTTTVKASGNITSKNVGIQVTGENGSGDVSVDTSGRIVADNIGLNIYNRGRGDLVINAMGPVEVSGVNSSGLGGAYTGWGIYAVNESLVGSVAAQNLTINAGDVKARSMGIQAHNDGYGETTIISTGTVEANSGIRASNSILGKGIRVEAKNVIAGYDGISTANYGSGDTTIVTTGTILGAGYVGISASQNSSTGNLTIEASGDVHGKDYGVIALSNSDALLNVTTHGVLEGGNAALYYRGSASGQVEVNLNGTTRNASNLSIDTAIDGHGGNAVITNNGSMAGVVKLSASDEVLTNKGVWNTAGGVNEFGAGNDAVVNSGTIIAANDAGAAETTLFNGLEDFTNESGGILSMRDGTAGDQTIISGNYIGNGGMLLIDTVLDGTGSQTDMLQIEGDAKGTTNVFVTNTSGTGAFTGTGATDGIQIVQVGGASNADFKLGSAAIVGIYDYQLKKADGQNWYLQTEGSDIVDPPVDPVNPGGGGENPGNGGGSGNPGTGHVVDIVPGYNIALSAAQNHVLTSLDTFHERLGELRAEELQDGYHAWMRGIGKTGSYSPKSITGYNGHGFDMTTAGVQIGADYSKSDVFVAGDKLTVGIFGEYANSSFDVRGRTADGSI